MPYRVVYLLRSLQAVTVVRTAKLLTNTVDMIRARLEAAQARERAARADAARLRRELAGADRRREAQRLCVLGRAWESWATRDPAYRASAVRFLAAYVNRDIDRAALIGTAWEVSAPVVVETPGE